MRAALFASPFSSSASSSSLEEDKILFELPRLFDKNEGREEASQVFSLLLLHDGKGTRGRSGVHSHIT